MAQNITIAGASFTDVPSIDVPKTGGGTASFTDVTGTTALAADVASGKYFFNASGVLTLGTASGGGGGLIYETGVFKPTSDIAEPTIQFANTHTTLPFFALMVDVDGYISTVNANLLWFFVSYEMLFGSGIYPNQSTIRYGECRYYWRTSASAMSSTTSGLIYPASNTNSSSTSYQRYWAEETCIKPNCANASRYWIANRTYKWIAVWKP